MNMMEFLQIAQHTASRIGTAIDRCDIHYLVKFRNEFYKLEDEMDEEEFSLYIYHKYMDRLEGEEDLRDDN